MKIGPKLAICFVALAVLPLGAASLVYLHATGEFGQEMAERGKAALAERLTDDLRRATEHGAVSIEETRRRIAQEVRLLAADISARLAAPGPAPKDSRLDPSFVLEESIAAEPAGSTEGNGRRIDLDRMSVRVSSDAGRDQIAGTLHKLSGLSEIARTIYLRNRNTVTDITVALENGLTVSFPGGVAPGGDPRESEWYLGTLERLETDFYGSAADGVQLVVAAAPVAFPDGRLAGVARVAIRLDSALSRALQSTQIPPEATAYLIAVPNDDPELLPHEIAAMTPEDRRWNVHASTGPLSLDGDDAWLKVVSDLRTGVPGLEYVQRGGRREVWAFGPVTRTADAALLLAAVFPAEKIDSARLRAEEVVHAAYMAQARNALAFAALAGTLAVILALVGARTLTRPIRRLHQAARLLAAGDFTVRVEVDQRKDEIGELSRGFNRMVPALEEQLKVKRDLHAAREIQQHLVPKTAPHLDGFDIAGRTVYCDETGGDYQDYIDLGSDGRLAAVIGDVTGHGIGAALLMANARAVLRANAPHAETPSALIGAVNRQLTHDAAGGRFLTLFYVQLTPGSRQFEWISAGHERTLLYDPADDSFTYLDGDGIPLGVDGDWTFTAATAEIPEGGLLVAYTDGIREAGNDKGENYGIERLKTAVRDARQRGSRAVCEHILADLDAFRGGATVIDDVSVLVIRPI